MVHILRLCNIKVPIQKVVKVKDVCTFRLTC